MKPGEGNGTAQPTIFRETAIAAYRRGTDRDTLPRLTSWPTIVFAWLLLAGLALAAVVVGSVRVPAYVAASGVILETGPGSGPSGEATSAKETTAVLFLAPGESSRVRVGQAVQGRIGSTATYVDGVVRSIEPGVVGPDAARARFGLGDSSDVVVQPSRVVIVTISPALAPSAYAGSRWTAQIALGSESLLGFLSSP
jgi:hypothetical protein